jgi:hypothetical protein
MDEEGEWLCRSLQTNSRMTTHKETNNINALISGGIDPVNLLVCTLLLSQNRAHAIHKHQRAKVHVLSFRHKAYTPENTSSRHWQAKHGHKERLIMKHVGTL